MKARFLDWLDHRTGYRAFVHDALYEHVPGGARWRYVWGSTLTFVFFVQVVTGLFLWTGYSASTRTAWESVYFIQEEMTLGWFVRGIHHFAAQAMIVLLAIHLVQVIVDGAYRAPREVNFWLGLVLMQIVLGLGLTGYLLPWDQKGYYATQVATEIMGSTPLVGPQIQQLMQGGPAYGHHTLTRFFALHAGILPALLIAFLGLHVYVFRRHGLTVKEPRKGPDVMFWPDQVLKDAVACLGILMVVMALAVWKGAELTAPANPAEAYSAARPEWYYLFLFRFLKFEWVSQLGEATHLGEAFGAIVVPGALMGVLVLMPLIGRSRAGHLFNVAFLAITMLAATSLTGVALYEDWYQQDQDSLEFREAVAQAHADGERAVFLSSHKGVPADGAIALMRDDPLTQGPKLFKVYCVDCHQPKALAARFTRPPQAPELWDMEDRTQVSFGDRAWLRSVLTDFENHFANLKNVTTANAASGERVAGAEAILAGSMKDWSAANGPLLLQESNQEDFTALVEFLYCQSGRSDAKPPDDPVVLRGREIFETGTLADGQFDSACIDCHTMHARGDAEPLSTDLFPILTGYSGADWLRAFIADPQAHYAGGDVGNNAMPGYVDQLSEHELSMLVRWIVGDYDLPVADTVTGSAP